MDYLVGRDGVVTIATTTPSSPAVLTDGGATKVVLMPMFVDWDGKPPVEKVEEKPEGIPHEPEASMEQEKPPAEVQETPPAAKAKPKKKRRKAA